MLRAGVEAIFDQFLCIDGIIVGSNFWKDGYSVIHIFIFDGRFDVAKVSSWWYFES